MTAYGYVSNRPMSRIDPQGLQETPGEPQGGFTAIHINGVDYPIEQFTLDPQELERLSGKPQQPASENNLPPMEEVMANMLVLAPFEPVLAILSLSHPGAAEEVEEMRQSLRPFPYKSPEAARIGGGMELGLSALASVGFSAARAADAAAAGVRVAPSPKMSTSSKGVPTVPSVARGASIDRVLMSLRDEATRLTRNISAGGEKALSPKMFGSVNDAVFKSLVKQAIEEGRLPSTLRVSPASLNVPGSALMCAHSYMSGDQSLVEVR
jgi:hypothetical protein